MQIPTGHHCPLLNKPCILQECMFWTKLYGHHPQTGELMDEYDCAIKWLPLLLIENAKETRQGAKATESFRNEVVRINAYEEAKRIT